MPPDKLPGGRQPAVRLVCACDDDGIRVLSRTHLEQAVPPSYPVETARQQAGLRMEVRDPAGRTKYVRPVIDPRDTEVEVPDEREEGRFTFVTVERRCETFPLLVPDFGVGSEVVLVDRGRGQGVETMRTTEVARLAVHRPH